MTSSSRRLPGLVAILLLSFSLTVGFSAPCQAEEGAPAQALLQIRPVPMTAPIGEPPAFDPEEFALYKSTHATLIQSRYVLQPALDMQGIRSLPSFREVENKIVWLQEHVTVSFPGDDLIMVLEFHGGSADDNQKILRAIVVSYLDSVVNAEAREEFARLQYLHTQHRDTDRNCVDLRTTIAEARAEAGDEELLTQPTVEIAQMQFALELEEAHLAEISRAIYRLVMRVELDRRVRLLQEARTLE